MATDAVIPPLPPGFQLETAGAAVPPLPPGFVIEEPAPPAAGLGAIPGDAPEAPAAPTSKARQRLQREQERQQRLAAMPPPAPPPRQVGFFESAGRAAGAATIPVVQTIGLAGAQIASIFGDEVRDGIFREVDERVESMRQMYQPQAGEEFSTAGSVAGGLAAMPVEMVGGMGLQRGIGKAQDVIQAGGSMDEAALAGGVTGAANLAANFLPVKAGGAAGRAVENMLGGAAAARAGGKVAQYGVPASKYASGAATGAVLGAAGDTGVVAATNAALPEGKQFDPLREESDPALSAGLGAAFGAYGARAARGAKKGAEPGAPGRQPGAAAAQGDLGAAKADDERVRRERAAAFGIELSKGQATQDFEQQRLEREGAKTERGGKLREAFSEQNRRFIQEVENLMEQTGAEQPDALGVGAEVTGALKAELEAARDDYRQKYETARAVGELERPVNTAGLVQTLNDNETRQGTAPNLRGIERELVRLGGATLDENGRLVPGQLDINRLEELRKFVGSTTEGSSNSQRDAARLVKDSIDATLDESGGDVYQTARRAYAQTMSRFKDRKLINDLTTTVKGDRKVALEDVFTRSVIGGSHADLTHLKDTLLRGGDKGKQAWRELQGATLQRLRDAMTSNVGRDIAGRPVVSPAKLQAALRSLDADGKLELIYGKKGAEQLRELGQLASDLYVTPEGTVNRSNTASALQAMVNRGIQIATGGNPVLSAPFEALVRMVVSGASGRKLNAALKQPKGLKAAERKLDPYARPFEPEEPAPLPEAGLKRIPVGEAIEVPLDVIEPAAAPRGGGSTAPQRPAAPRSAGGEGPGLGRPGISPLKAVKSVDPETRAAIERAEAEGWLEDVRAAGGDDADVVMGAKLSAADKIDSAAVDAAVLRHAGDPKGLANEIDRILRGDRDANANREAPGAPARQERAGDEPAKGTGTEGRPGIKFRGQEARPAARDEGQAAGRPVGQSASGTMAAGKGGGQLAARSSSVAAPVVPTVATSTPRATPSNPAAALARAVEALKAEEGIDADLTVAPPPKGSEKLVADIKRAFGHDVVFYDSPGRFADGFVTDSVPGTIFVSAKSQRPARAVIGHELTHALRTGASPVYDVLERAIGKLLQDPEKHGLDLNATRRAAGLKDLDAGALREELIADVVGDQLDKPSFWRAVAGETPRGFRGLATRALDAIGDALARLRRGRGFGTSEMIRDLNAARRAIKEALGDYQEIELPPRNGRGQFDYADAASRLFEPTDYGDTTSGNARFSLPKEDTERTGKLDVHTLGAERGERVMGKVAKLSPEEVAAVKEGSEASGVPVALITQQVREAKLAHPAKDGWAPLVLKRVVVEKGKKGKPDKAVPEYQAIPYSFNAGKAEDGKKARSLVKGTPEYDKRVRGLAGAMRDEVRGILDRSRTGVDKAAENIIAQAGWYREMRSRLRREFGGLGDLFADLLGATSPNTPVRTNWDNTVEAMRRAQRGDFDELMPKWVEFHDRLDAAEQEMRAWFDTKLAQGLTKKAITELPEYEAARAKLSELRKFPDELLPVKESGTKYGFNGYNVVRAMVDLWRVTADADPDIARGATAPKAINFSGNLIGFKARATIDVWAARMLQRLAGGKRIPSAAETGVSGDLLSTGETTQQFGMGQDVFGAAVKLIRSDPAMSDNATLRTLNDDDLQALVWFIEKEHWTRNNWTSAAGEGGSFEFEANLAGTRDLERVKELRRQADTNATGLKAGASPERKAAAEAKLKASKAAAAAELQDIARTVDRAFAGLSIEQSMSNQGVDFVPQSADQARVAERLRTAIYEADDGATVIASKSAATKGFYLGSPENSIDMELVTREGYDHKRVADEIFRIADENKQDSAFLARVLRANETVDPLRHRPGVEVYFRDMGDLAKVKPLLDDIHAQGQDFLTAIVDGRRSEAFKSGEVPSVVGVRFMFLPEFEVRYGDGDRFSGLSDAELAKLMEDKHGELEDLAERIAKEVPGVNFAAAFNYDVDARFAGEYQEAISGSGKAERLPSAAAGAARGQAWQGRDLRAALASANRRVPQGGVGQGEPGAEPGVVGLPQEVEPGSSTKLSIARAPKSFGRPKPERDPMRDFRRGGIAARAARAGANAAMQQERERDRLDGR